MKTAKKIRSIKATAWNRYTIKTPLSPSKA
jgi:hypothetical protein